MTLIVDNVFWILIVSGVLTCTMIFFVLIPSQSFSIAFGEKSPESAAVGIVARTLGAVVTATGVMLIIAAYDESIRAWVLLFASVGKLVFAGAVLARGRLYMGTRAFPAAIIDLVMVALFLTYLVSE